MTAATNIVLEAGLGLRRVLGHHPRAVVAAQAVILDGTEIGATAVHRVQAEAFQEVQRSVLVLSYLFRFSFPSLKDLLTANFIIDHS
jgi:hypothetical protein